MVSMISIKCGGWGSHKLDQFNYEQSVLDDQYVSVETKMYHFKVESDFDM